MPEITLYRLYREKDRFVKWEGPGRASHSIDVENPPSPSTSWTVTRDLAGRPVMAYSPDALGDDGTLVVSLEGAPSFIATLLHAEDDYPRKYYFATDGGNHNPLKCPAFILRCEGEGRSPIPPWASFYVMVVGP
jgi:hypothetical protein